MINAEYVKTIFPVFASESDDRIALFIGISALSVPLSVWGDLTDPATAYLTAHMLTMADRGKNGAGGAVTQSKVGDLSRSYSDASSKLDSELSATPYGVEYLRLRRMIPITPMVTC